MRGIAIIIDKLTRSIEDTRSGERVETNVYRLKMEDASQIKKTQWLFDWRWELIQPGREVFKLVTVADPGRIQGLVSLERREDHVFLHLVESAKINRGKNKKYYGVAGNLFAFACKMAYEYGFEGYVAFDSKTKLIQHYIETFGATRMYGQRLFFKPSVANSLVNRYFGQYEEGQDGHH